jgi:hypothetical protein
LLTTTPGLAQDVGEAPAAATATGPVAGYRKGFFIRAADGPFELRLEGRVQTRLALENPEGAANEYESAFSIPRARLVLSGRAFLEALGYKFQADFGKGFVALKDFYADYALVPGWLQLRVGQWKRPFSRQQLTSSGRLELVDRSITDKFFGAGRDIGLAIHNDYEHSPTFEYAFGVFNGTGDKSIFSADASVDPTTGDGQVTGGTFTNVPDRMHPALVLRVGYNHGGIKGYSEADLEAGPLRFAVGASGLLDLDADADDASLVRGELDFALKVHGLSSTGGLYVSSAQSGTSFSDRSFEAVGFHAQAGYLIARRYQPALRYALIAPDGPGNDLQEVLAGFSVYFFDHGLKWQTDVGALNREEAGGRRTDSLVRTQLQLAF